MSKPTSNRHRWTESENELLRQRYPHERTTDLAAELGLSVGKVYAQAGRLGLNKSEAFAASSASGRILRGGKLGQAHQFKAGQVPKNKGVKGWQAGGRAVLTQFKPGIKPHTWVPVGSLRVTPDGYLERKINDDKGPSNVRWRGVHRLLWEAAYGPTPAGHVVTFKPGRHTTQLEGITLDTIELVSRAELMRRNSIHQLPAELAELHRIRGVLKRAPTGEVAAEAFSAVLLRAWGLPVPEPFLVAEPSGLAFASADATYPSLRKRLALDTLPPGPALETARSLGALLASSLPTAGLAAAADEAILNHDRNLGNILWDGTAEAWIDHAYALGMAPPHVGNANKLCVMSVHAGTHQALRTASIGRALTLDRDAPAAAGYALPDALNGQALAEVVARRLATLAAHLLIRFPQPTDLLSGL